ncbi:tRNA (adenosine(37)-N6)-threonylcarbamoyltransferase complex transferase subunit TsaD [bacterium]|nr:tRNA (adenosine(37)-N6)-threonylcarbamoyltransferase complex transferase subunit TsaD [bacterium]
MIVLGIETSCDDTSAAVFNGKSLLANVISTQLVHRNFGGVVPELASRSHIRLILPVIRQALDQAGLQRSHIEGIAVTYGPGLAGSLLVGLSVAKGLAQALEVPYIGINHLEGHIWANRLDNERLAPPFIVLIASGGHTQLVLVESWGEYQILGRTVDDAAGEAFDKVAKILDVGYPGGPAIEKLAKDGDPDYIRFPRARLKAAGPYDFSFSGLKTSVLNHVQSIGREQTRIHIRDIAACFQEAVTAVLVDHTLRAAQEHQISQICLAGGVAVNKFLQQAMIHAACRSNKHVFWPTAVLCTDNGGMIARAGYFYLKKKQKSSFRLSPVPALNF